MTEWLWLTLLESSEPVGIPIARISMIEQKGPATGSVVTIFLDSGKEVQVMECLAEVRRKLDR
ncbi:MAG: hypothetical protein AAFP68_13625 [Pseudomonadota bacterium]